MLDAREDCPQEPYDKQASELARRIVDIAFSCLALILLSPAFLLIVIAIWVESGRPIFFKQVRLGRYGRPFYMYKFRKFHKDCGSSGPPLTLEKDPRLTIVGRFLAASKFDELPQFWNTLRGDMSIIGPRPESLAFADCFTGTFRDVLDHKPGILGPSQVAFRNEAALYPRGVDPSEFYRVEVFPIKASIDLQYYSKRSLFRDILWLAYGILAVLKVVPNQPQAQMPETSIESPQILMQRPTTSMIIRSAVTTRGTEA